MRFVRIQIEPVWRFRREGGPESIPVMLDLLDSIQQTGKISRAADRANLSYRHAWNLIAKWSAFFEVPLVERKQGSGTSLTPLGARLVSAGQRLQTRLGTQLQSCSREFETEINQLLPSGQAVIRVHAGHGFAVSKLKEILGSEVDLRVAGVVTHSFRSKKTSAISPGWAFRRGRGAIRILRQFGVPSLPERIAWWAL